ncbi:MAG TPA: SUMF1/EgtB/PvdO family nonheme iron enzyme, partial [Polyangiaceae bacterium]|nr:SUMF1/EgtB/PvdO family nonheme iron enzyme [Polyangiaceae bacterium]
RCPPEMSAVGGVCVDRWEAHLIEVASGRVHSPYERIVAGVRYAARAAAGRVPQGYVSRDEAAAACQAAGKRLCRAREWHAACQGSRRTRYPYGPEFVEGRCNVGKPHLLHQVFGEGVTFTFDAHYNSPRLNQEPGFLARTGEYAGCVNDYGLFDMVGNLHEWVADRVTSQLRREIPLEYGDHELGPRGNGVFMGGYLSSKHEHGHGCGYVTTAHRPDYHDYSTGFRCCRDAGTAPAAAP